MDDASVPLTTCARCEQPTDDPDRDGWHIFSDGTHEQHAICADCAPQRARHHAGQPVPLGTGVRTEIVVS